MIDLGNYISAPKVLPRNAAIDRPKLNKAFLRCSGFARNRTLDHLSAKSTVWIDKRKEKLGNVIVDRRAVTCATSTTSTDRKGEEWLSKLESYLVDGSKRS